MKPEYEPKTTAQKLGYLVEECGEVLAAVGKSLRWGLDSVNPELSKDEQETNVSWILRELDDLELSLNMARDDLKKERLVIECRHPEHRPVETLRATGLSYIEGPRHVCPNCGLVSETKEPNPGSFGMRHVPEKGPSE